MTASTDPIADMLTRIRNGYAVSKDTVSLPHSKTKEAVARLLSDNNFIGPVKVEAAASGIGNTLVLQLTPADAKNHITEIVRISRPGRRTYASATKIPVIKRGRGVVIISTSKGMMTGDQAKKEKVGGELICKVY